MPNPKKPFRQQPRPTGVIQPDSEPARRALRAIAENRLAHAEENITRIAQDDEVLRTWAQVLQGMLDLARLKTACAEKSLRHALPARPADPKTLPPRHDDRMPRLSAFAWHQLGILYRRQDSPEAAAQAHQAAFDLRDEHGSYEELWESALALGLDLDLAAKHAVAQTWYRTAGAAAARAQEGPIEKQAVALSHLSTSLLQGEKFEDAVDAADAARSSWQKHDITAPTATQAEMRLGHALLRLGACLLERSDRTATQKLAEALRLLRGAKESFEAFGHDYDADRIYCAEQIDFAERLQSSIGSD